MIQNIDEQVEKAVAEIEMRYIEGAKFNLHMLTASFVCASEINYDHYINVLQRTIENNGIAKFYKLDKGEKIYIKL